MKYGYLEFRHKKNPDSKKNIGSDFSANVGDNIQSLAARNALLRLGIGESEIVGIDRDSIATYAGEEVSLLLNGVIFPHSFPISSSIIPIFFGINIPDESIIKKNREYFLRYAPIGCRDLSTQSKFEKFKIDAFCTGCITLTLDNKEKILHGGNVISFGDHAGSFPDGLLSIIPKPILENSRLVFQRELTTAPPLDDEAVSHLNNIAIEYLRIYSNSNLVITPLLHVASPCLGMGVPVIVVRNKFSSRFSGIDRILPVYTKDFFKKIDWTPNKIDICDLKCNMLMLLNKMISMERIHSNDYEFLEKTYKAKPIINHSRSNWLSNYNI